MLASTYMMDLTAASRSARMLQHLLASVGLVPAAEPIPALASWRRGTR